MGKNVIIKGADFSENALPVLYVYNYSDSLFGQANGNWSPNGAGYAITDVQAALAIRNKRLLGVRMNVSTAGSMAIYKCSDLDGSADALTYLCTIQTDVLGIQNLMFDSPIMLNDGEFLVFGNPNESFSLIPKSTSGSSAVINQLFVYLVGKNKTEATKGSILVDFFYQT